MTRVCAIDLGFRVGFGVIGARYVQSGSFPIKGSSEDMGTTFRSLRDLLARLVKDHEPVALAVVRPFISRDPKKRNPVTLRPILGMSCKIEEFALDAGLPLLKYSESDARKAFLAHVPRTSPDIKAAVMEGCRLRGWPVCDDHAADALCIADFARNHLQPYRAHETTPLFVKRRRRRRSA